MLTITDLERLSETIGVTITTHMGGHDKGKWYSKSRSISIHKNLGPTQHLCALAHELGHAALEHDSDATGWHQARQERAADEWAARALINADDYAAAEQRHHSPGAIAHELGVTVHLVRVWQRLHERHASVVL